MDEEPKPPPKTPKEVLAILKQGREAWNQWRDENPGVRPNLEGVDFTDAKEFEGTPIWGRPYSDSRKDVVFLVCFNLKGADLYKARLKGANLQGANLEGAYLPEANLEGAKLNWAQLKGAGLMGADLEGAELRGAHLERAELRGAHLERADLERANLQLADLQDARLCGANLQSANLERTDMRETDMLEVDVTDADMRGANLQGAMVMGIKYNRRKMHGKYLGINAAECYGNANFRRDAMDQDYIDAQRENSKKSWWRGFWLWAWSFFTDYGRSLWRVGVLSLAIVLAFGSIYRVSAPIAGGVCPTEAMARPGAHVEYIGARGGANVGVCNGLTPYYAAAVSFSTLGFTDVIRPTDVWGQIALMFNVLAGYFILGLLMAILANQVARRA